jgi:hypothetical protein
VVLRVWRNYGGNERRRLVLRGRLGSAGLSGPLRKFLTPINGVFGLSALSFEKLAPRDREWGTFRSARRQAQLAYRNVVKPGR